MINDQRSKRIAGAVLSVAVLALSGCATSTESTSKTVASSGARPSSPPPAVQECALISSGSPSKYVCDDKTYTTLELAKMRTEYAAQQQAGK